ncbi:MAG: site-2 protease family protein [Gammaproteobacteria bacterium]
MIELTLIQKICAAIIPVLFAITVHEVAHGWVANRLGDPTAKMMGRLTLNPFKHIDPIGTVLVPLLTLYLGGVLFGWAKPVPINSRYFKHFRRDVALVSIAGPLSNFFMACFWALLLHVTSNAHLGVSLMCQIGITINLVLGVLNLIPIPPLDGSRVVSSLLPRRWAYYYDRIEPYGFFILLALYFLGILTAIMDPILQFLLQLFMGSHL